MDVEGVVEEEPRQDHAASPLPRRSNGRAVLAHASRSRRPSVLTATDVDGMSLVVANVEGTLLAYRNRVRELRRRRSTAARSTAAR